MLNIYLKINDVTIKPTLFFPSPEVDYIFDNLSFIKSGFFNRRIIGAFPGEKIYLCKNCKLSLLNCFELPANLDEYDFRSIIKDHIVSGTWGTSAFLSFYNKRLFKIAIQVIYNNSIASMFFSLCKDKLFSLYGKPSVESNVRLLWKDSESHIILSFLVKHSNLIFCRKS